MISANKPISQFLANLSRFRFAIQPYRRYFLLAVFAILGIAITNTAMIWLLGKPLDLLQQGQYQLLPYYGAAFAIIVIFNQLFHFFGTTLNAWLVLQAIGQIRTKLLEHCLKVSFPVIDHYSKGDILTRLSNDLDKVSRLTIDTLLMFISHCLILVFYAAMLFFIDTELAIFAFITTPLFLLHQHLFGARKKKYSDRFLSDLGRLLSFEAEALSSLKGISSFNAETELAKTHKKIFNEAKQSAMKGKWLDATFGASFSALLYLSGLAIVLIGIHKVIQQEVTSGQLLSFLLYLGYLTVPIRGIAQLGLLAQEDAAAADRVYALLQLKNNVDELINATALLVSKGTVEFQNINFGYHPNRRILTNINFRVERGKTVALVGPSGSGKSTLAKLLLRYYDPDQGAILIDGIDIRSVTLHSLRQNIAVVWQEPFLLNHTIRANLLLSRNGATEEQIIQACMYSYCWDFIKDLPNGLDTILGAGGIEISAGQRQRLAIAQAFLRNAPILFLDEFSSALDSQAEELIVQAMEILKKGRTTFIIAHRYSSIRTADAIAYFDPDGSLIYGDHQTLLRTSPGYQQAVEWQTNYQK